MTLDRRHFVGASGIGLLASQIPGIAWGQPASEWTIARVVAQEPARLRSLLAALDVSRPGLERVARAQAAADLPAAAAALVAYYRGDRPARTVLRPLIAASPEIQREAIAAQGDVFTFQGVTGKVPRTGGGLDWTHRGPRDDVEFAYFLNRHNHLLPLVRSGDAASARYAARSLIDWVRTRPPEDLPREADMSAAWKPMSAASRLLQTWPQTFYGFADQPAFDDGALLLMLASVPEQAQHLRKHHRPRHNHTIKEMAGLAHAAVVWPEFRDATAWYDYALLTLAGELKGQFYPDGVHIELSSHYHRSALDYYRSVIDFSTASGRRPPQGFAESVERALDYLARTISPIGYGILNNNADRDRNDVLLAEVARAFRRDDWLYAATNGAAGTAPSQGSTGYPYAGQAIFRNGWGREAHYSFFDVGPWGAAHQHNDKLNLTITAHGRELLSDGGRYRYTADDPLVAYVRGSSGHNVVLVDGHGQGPDKPLAQSPLTDAFHFSDVADFAHGSHDAGFAGAAGQVRHARALAYIRDGYWLVVDQVVTDRPRDITALWRFHPALTVDAQGTSAMSIDAGVGNLRIDPADGKGWSLDIVRGQREPLPMGWYSPEYNEIVPASVAVYRKRIAGTALFAWVLSPAKGRVAAPRIDVVSSDSDHIVVDVARPGQATDRLAVRMGGMARIRLDKRNLLDGRFGLKRGNGAPRAIDGAIVNA